MNPGQVTLHKMTVSNLGRLVTMPIRRRSLAEHSAGRWPGPSMPATTSGKKELRMSDIAPSGLHHVTAIASGPQRNVDFYTRVLGLRLVKQTVNFDAPTHAASTTATRWDGHRRS